MLRYAYIRKRYTLIVQEFPLKPIRKEWIGDAYSCNHIRPAYIYRAIKEGTMKAKPITITSTSTKEEGT